MNQLLKQQITYINHNDKIYKFTKTIEIVQAPITDTIDLTQEEKPVIIDLT